MYIIITAYHINMMTFIVVVAVAVTLCSQWNKTRDTEACEETALTCLRNRLPVGGGCVYVLQIFFCIFLFFFRPSKIWDNRSRERLNGFLWNFYQTIGEDVVWNVVPPPGEWWMLTWHSFTYATAGKTKANWCDLVTMSFDSCMYVCMYVYRQFTVRIFG